MSFTETRATSVMTPTTQTQERRSAASPVEPHKQSHGGLNGQHSSRSTLIDGQRVIFTTAERFMFMALWNARGVPLSLYQLCDAGNCTSEGSAAVMLFRVRGKLEPTLFRVVSERKGFYRLARLQKEQMAA